MQQLIYYNCDYLPTPNPMALVGTVPQPTWRRVQSGQCRGRPRADRALMLTYVVYMTMAVNALAMAWPRNACGAPRAAFAAQDQAYGVLAGTRGAWGVFFSLYMMSYEVSECRFFQYYIKAILD